MLASAAVFCYLLARACIQSVTIDEADSFLTFATGPPWAVWYPSAANHLLNTLLERLSWTIFGFNQVSMRLPALLGAVIYLIAAISICERFTGAFFRLAVFVCLVLNPFVLDYLVAARGYSLAVGFLLAAIALFWRILDQKHSLQWVALCSILLALSVAANFSFAIADLMVGATLLTAVAFSQRRQAALAGIYGILPGAAVVLFLCSSLLLHSRGSEFYYGARSLHEMWNSLRDAAFPAPNPEIVNELLYPMWSWIRIPLCAAAVVLLGVQIAALLVRRQASALIAITLSCAAILTVALHWLAFHKIGLPLPKARTGLFFAPLLTLILAAGTNSFQRNRWRAHGTVVLTLCAAYFLTCLRFHYFQEWRFNEDTKQVFWVARDIERRCGIHDFATEWHYVAALNFYRMQYQAYSMKPFVAVHKDSFPKDKDSYIFWYFDGEPLLKSERLAVWYHNESNGTTVAVRACNSVQLSGIGAVMPAKIAATGIVFSSPNRERAN